MIGYLSIFVVILLKLITLHYTTSCGMKLQGILDIFKIIFLPNKRMPKYTEKKKQTSDKIKTIRKKILLYISICV